MKENIQNNCFIIGKTICLFLVLISQIVMSDEILLDKSFHGLYISIFVLFGVLIEFLSVKKHIIIILGIEGILSILGVFLFPVTGLIFMMFFWADFCANLKFNWGWYLVLFIVSVMLHNQGYSIELSYGLAIFIFITYFQEKLIISKYRKDIIWEENLQSELRIDMENQSINHARELEKSHLKYENDMLADRNRISQALHDKLGHSINGSLYQLEAAKLLVGKKPEDAQKIIQGVIDQLRISMDEIRAILRSEKPDKKRLALLSLQSLCDDCECKYNINTTLNVDDAEGKISEKSWEIILDNTYEAVTNALKYSGCSELSIDIIALNEIVRCTIHDNGKGCNEIDYGMGISGMKKRVRDARGYIDIESEVGFTINMILPI